MKIALMCIVALLLISATSLITTKPSLPRSVRHKVFTKSMEYGSAFTEADKYIGQCVKDGYIIKCVSVGYAGSYGSYESVIVVAEKY